MIKKILRGAARLFREEDGPTTVEYAVMLMIIILGCVTAIRVIGQSSADSFRTTANGINEVVGQNN